jgi:hypothetical protein
MSAMKHNLGPARLSGIGRVRKPEADSLTQQAILHNFHSHPEETIRMGRMHLKRLPTTEELDEVSMEAGAFTDAFNTKAIPGDSFTAEVMVNADGNVDLNGWILPPSTSW